MKDLSTRQSLDLPVVKGATTPPGRLGAQIWSTTLNRMVTWNGSAWVPDYKTDAAVLGHLNSSSISAVRTKIRLETAAGSRMVSFHIHVYQSYQYFLIRVSGYFYAPTGTWHAPKASLIEGDASINVILGKDTDGVLYVSISGANHRGVTVTALNTGYVTSLAAGLACELSFNDDTPNIAFNQTLDPPDTRIRNRVLEGAPAGPTAAGVQGDLRADANYIYRAVGPNSWKRAPLLSFTQELGTAAFKAVGAAAGNLPEVGMGGLLTRLVLDSPGFEIRSFRLGYTSGDGPQAIPNIAGASDILIFGSVPATGTQTGFIGRFRNNSGTWTFQNLYGATGSTNYPAITVSGNQPCVVSTHPGLYNYDWFMLIDKASASGSSHAFDGLAAAIRAGNLAQSLGTSADFPMSQKATTDAVSPAPVVVSASATVSLLGRNAVYAADTTAGPMTLTLPLNPLPGTRVTVLDYASSFGSNNLIVARNGQKIMGQLDNYLLDTNNQGRDFIFVDSVKGWLVK